MGEEKFIEDFWGCTKSPMACCLATAGGWHYIQCENKNRYAGDGGISACMIAWCLGCIGMAYNRSKMREHFQIQGSCPMECLMYWCCYLGCCASTQEYRETRTRLKQGK
jgi:Cys-rich protein (TIGR01571 family)